VNIYKARHSLPPLPWDYHLNSLSVSKEKKLRESAKCPDQTRAVNFKQVKGGRDDRKG
jgi:hypothetical protein